CGWISTMMEAAVPGATEGEIAGKGLRFMAEHGGIPADVDIASGPTAHKLKSQYAIPTWNPDRVLERGDLFHVDGWGSVGGYYTDTVRSTIVASSPSTEQEEILEGTIALVEHLCEAMRPGIRCREINEIGIAWLRENGFEDQLPTGANADTSQILHFQM